MPYNRLENELRGVARELIRAGRLPCGPPAHMWGGYGCDLPCSLCEQVILRSDVEYEIEQRTADGLKQYRFHFLCHAAWQLECIREQTLRAETA